MTGWLTAIGPAVGNHLWQTTAFAAAWAATLLLRRNAARVRHGLWLAASLKFLVPFSLLIGLGGMLPRPQRAVVAPAVYSAVDSAAQPFSQMPVEVAPVAVYRSPMQRFEHLLPALLLAVWLCGVAMVLLVWFARWRQVARTLRRATRAESGREVAILRRVEAAMGGRIPWWRLAPRRTFSPMPDVPLSPGIPLLLSHELMEPGIFGVFRPVLIWPERLSERLDDEHIEAVLMHELMHARRRDNLTAALHMLVEAAFWFHPMVWWMGRRMVEERERACDEAVVAMGSTPGVYAESLLKAVRFCVESPLACVAGITGADLNKRVRSIMTLRLERITWPKKLLLVAAAVCVAAVPIVLGQAATDVKPMAFDAVSIRQDKTGGQQIFGQATPDGYEMRNMFLIAPIMTAYPPTGGASVYDQIIGGPDWLTSDADRYNIDAKVDPADLADWQNPKKQPAMLRAMLQAMLADRMKLKVHRSTKDAPVYSLVVGKNGPKFKPTNPNEPHPGSYPMPGGGEISRPEIKNGWMTAHYFGISIGQLVQFLPQMGRPVEDRTGLTGKYDVTIVRQAPLNAGTPEVGPAPETSAADIADQLGLKLEKAEGPVETLVIDHIERPSPN